MQNSNENPIDAEPQDGEMNWVEHLDELRHRLMNCVYAWLVGALASYAFSGKILSFLKEPLIKILPP